MTNLQEILAQLRQTPKEQRPQVLAQLKSQLRTKLQNKVLEIAELPDGDTKKDIFEYIDIAKEYSLSDEAALLEANALAAFRESLLSPKKEIRMKEKNLEDFIAQADNLGKLFPGLVFKERQGGLITGFIDCVAKNPSTSEEYLVELKAARDTEQKLDYQLTKYMEERPGMKLIIGTPEIDAGLFLNLTNRFRGRFKYFLVDENEEGNYSSREITEQEVRSLPPKKKRNFKKANDKETDTISFRKRRVNSTPVYEKPKAQEKQPAERRAETERESPIQEVSGLPILSTKNFVYKMLLATTNNLPEGLRLSDDYEKHLGAIIKSTRSSSDAFKEYSKYIKWFERVPKNEKGFKEMFGDLHPILLEDLISDVGARKPDAREEKIFRQSIGKVNRLYELFAKAQDEFIAIEKEKDSLDAETTHQRINRVEAIVDKTKSKLSELKYTDKGMIKFRKYMRRAAKELTDQTLEAEMCSYQSEFLETNAALAVMSNKLKTARELLQINEQLATSYLRAGFDFLDRYSVSAEREARRMGLNEELVLSARAYKNFKWSRRDITDLILRASIMSSLLQKVDQSKKESSDSRKKVETPQSQQSQTPQTYSPLVQAITQNHNGELFTKDNLARIQYFAEDLATRVDYSIPEDKRQELAKSFEEFKLPKKLRHREERPNDLQLRTFFDYVTEAVYKSKQAGNVLVPTAQDLDKMYNKAKRGKE